MKRFLSFFLAGMMLLPMAACASGGNPPEETSGEQTSAPDTSAPDTSAPETSAPETTEKETETSAPETTAPAVAVELPVKEHPDPAVTRLLSENILRAESEDNAPDEPYTAVDFSGKAYAKLQNTEHHKTGDVSLTWKYGSNGSWTFKVPKDLSKYKAYSFWLYADQAAIGETFVLYFLSENSATEGMDYYSTTVKIQQAGWSLVSAKFAEMGVSRTPVGWDKIDGLILTSTGWDQTNKNTTVLYLDNIILHTNANVVNDTPIGGLENAAAFSLGGSRAVIDQTTVKISALDENSTVFEENGAYWLPLSAFAAVRDEKSDYNASTHVLNMTLGGKKYTFTGGSDKASVDGAEQSLGFTVRVNGDSLFVPHTYIQSLFGYSELYTDKMGLVILSNTKDLYDLDRDLNTLLSISYTTLFVRPTGEQVVEDMYDHLGGDVHPRVMLTEADFDRLKEYYKSDETFKSWVAVLETNYGITSKEYTDAAVKWELTDGVRLLAISRKARNRILPWALLYRVTGNKMYAERIWKDVDALCKFQDWHPTHFLDTAEICYPMAIAYDWLYDYWTPERRAMMEKATLEMGLNPGLDRYERRAGMWGDNNWTGVCNGGLTSAAIAYATALPEACTKVLGYAMEDVEKGMYTYAPDGGYLESPGYWSYGTDYLHVMMSSLDSACGTNYGLYKSPGFAASAYFTAYFETEIGCWGFHDSGSGVSDTNCLSWFAKESGDPSINRLRRNSIDQKVKKVNVYDLMWYDPNNISDTVELNLDAYYSEVGAVTMRSSWQKGATFTGLHGGANSASHGDLDVGNFFIDGAGKRFIMELGSDNYNIPSYFGNLRWTYYRKRAEGQNTLVIGKVSYKLPDQLPKAIAKFTRVENNEASSIAVVDMGVAYDTVESGQRGMFFKDNRTVIVLQDEIHLKSAAKVRWSAHTQGSVIINEGGRSAFIKRGDCYLYCEIVSDNKDLVFTSDKAKSFDKNYPKTSGESSLSGINKLMIVTPEGVNDFNCAVVFKVIGPGETAPGLGRSYTWTNIADWKLQ